MWISTRLSAALALGLGLGMGMPALAQQQGDTRAQERSERMRQQDVHLEAEPQGWVRIGYDLDQDGEFEAVEYLYAFDLREARERSSKRDRAERPRDQRQERHLRQQRAERPDRWERPFRQDRRDRIDGQGRMEQERRQRSADRAREQRDIHRALRAQEWRDRMRQQADRQRAEERRGDRRMQQPDRRRTNQRQGGPFQPQAQPNQPRWTQEDRRGQQPFVTSPREFQQRQQRNPQGLATARDQQQQRLGETLRWADGQIERLHTQRLIGSMDEHLLARIATADGETVKVDLGPKKQLSKLDLSEGDAVAVMGTLGSINNRPMLIAHRVRNGEDVVPVDRADDFNLRRMRGTVEALRTATVRDSDEKHTLARVRLVSGSNAVIALGSEEKLKKLKLEPGDEIAVLARSGKLNDQPALFAEQVRCNGEMAAGLHGDKAAHEIEKVDQAAVSQAQEAAGERQPPQEPEADEDDEAPREQQQQPDNPDAQASASDQQADQDQTQGEDNDEQSDEASPEADTPSGD